MINSLIVEIGISETGGLEDKSILIANEGVTTGVKIVDISVVTEATESRPETFETFRDWSLAAPDAGTEAVQEIGAV